MSLETPPMELEIKKLLIETLHLEEITPEEIESDAPLFVEGLGLDSIDALEIGLALQKRYGIIFSSDSESARKHFTSVRALSALVQEHRKK